MDINKEIEEKITVASADIGGKTSKKTSFKKIAKQALEHAAVVVEHFVPGGEIQGDYFVALNPTRADQNLGSFKLNLKTGQWGEFRPGFEASGSDLTSWVSYVKGISQGQAAKLITQFLATVDKPQIKSARLQKVDVWTPISAPAEAEDAGKTMFGNILNRTATYEYRNADDKVVCFVHRCDSAGHKSFLLQSFCEGPDGKREWRYQGPCIPRSLYRLDVLTHRPDSPVLVCEGEKSADAAQSLFPDYVCVTSMNGAKSAAKSDWSPLKGRLVSLWADNDDAGLKYVAEVAVILRNIDPTITLSLLKPITVCAGNDAKGQPVLTPGFNAPEGWDAANAVDEGWTADHMKLLGDDAWEELPVTAIEGTTYAVGEFQVSDEGVFRVFEKDGKAFSTLVCSRLDVIALTHDVNGENWGRLLRFKDTDGGVHEWSLPQDMLIGGEYRSILLGLGLNIYVLKPEVLHSYLMQANPKARAICVNKIGWHQDVFVMPDETFGRSDERILLQTKGVDGNRFRVSGGLIEWQRNVADLCRGNSRLIFAVSASLYESRFMGLQLFTR